MNFEMFQGDTKYINIPIYDKLNGSRVSVSGAQEVEFGLFPESPEAKTPFFKKTLASGITVQTDSGGGYPQILLASLDTASLLGKFYYECRVVDASGNAETVDKGYIQIQEARLV